MVYLPEVVPYCESVTNKYILWTVSYFSMLNDPSIHCSKQDPFTTKLNDFFGWIANAEYIGKVTVEYMDVILWSGEVIFYYITLHIVWCSFIFSFAYRKQAPHLPWDWIPMIKQNLSFSGEKMHWTDL